MNSLAQSTKELFPNLTFCEIVNKKEEQDTSKTLSPFETCVPVKNWVTWFCESDETVNYLRINLSDSSQLYFKKVSDNHYLLAYNEVKNAVQLIAYLDSIDINGLSNKSSTKETDQKEEIVDDKMQAAVRIQNMIIPKTFDIQQQFREFFVVHEQQDHVGGDFYWFRTVGSTTLLAMIDCTGHSLEGAMTSMVCNSLINQAVETTQSVDPVILLGEFYKLLEKYNATSEDILDYGIGAEIGLFSFNAGAKEFVFASTGICAFIKRGKEIEQLRVKRLMDYSKFSEKVTSSTYSIEGVECIYCFTDGLPDQFDAQDSKKLGKRGVMEMIKNEDKFSADYYNHEIAKWKGDNMQYDDITLFGVAL